jgi:hypothetical protein
MGKKIVANQIDTQSNDRWILVLQPPTGKSLYLVERTILRSGDCMPHYQRMRSNIGYGNGRSK